MILSNYFAAWLSIFILIVSVEGKESSSSKGKKKSSGKPKEATATKAQAKTQAKTEAKAQAQVKGSDGTFTDPFATLNPHLPLMTQIIQKDFLVQPKDFHKNENILYIMKQLRRPSVIQKYYKSAARIYDDLAKMYKEMQATESISRIFLDIMRRLTRASLNEPLHVTNIVYAVCRHLRPLFKTVSEPLEEMHNLLVLMEKSEHGQYLGIMTRFFRCFTIREVNPIQDFIKLMSLATLTTDAPPETVNDKSTPKSRLSKKNDLPLPPHIGHLDIRATGLIPHAHRAGVILSNALAKMLILMDLFINDPSVAMRTIEIFRYLWELHLRRMAAREGIPDGEFDPVWFNPILYRKMPINFQFEDWNPKYITPEIMASLSVAVEEELRNPNYEYDGDASLKPKPDESSGFLKKVAWIVFAFTFTLLTVIVVYYSYRKRQNKLEKETFVLEPDAENNPEIDEE